MFQISKSLALAVGLAGAAGPALAHPHIFIDGGLDFVLNDQNQLTHLKVTWDFDLFYSLFVLAEEELDTDGDGSLTPEEGRKLADLHSQWIEGFEGDSYVWSEGQPLKLSGPLQATAQTMDNGRIRMTFLRELAGPISAGDSVIAKAYDPTYYTAYAITETPRVAGGTGCRAEHRPVDLDGMLASLRDDLAQLDATMTPLDGDVGAQFADAVLLLCD